MNFSRKYLTLGVCKMAVEKDSGYMASGNRPWTWGFFIWNEAECPAPLAQLAPPEFLDSSVTREGDTSSCPLSFPARVWSLFWCLVVGFPWGYLSWAIVLILADKPWYQSWLTFRGEVEGGGGHWAEDEKPVADQHLWAQGEQEESPVQSPA